MKLLSSDYIYVVASPGQKCGSCGNVMVAFDIPNACVAARRG